MGRIEEMQYRINNRNVQKSKPRLDTKGIKNFYNKLRLAYKPDIENEYSLTRSQRRFARNMRMRNFSWYSCSSYFTYTSRCSNKSFFSRKHSRKKCL